MVRRMSEKSVIIFISLISSNVSEVTGILKRTLGLMAYFLTLLAQ